MIFRGNTRTIAPVVEENEAGELSMRPRILWTMDSNSNWQCHTYNTAVADGICTYAKKYYWSGSTVAQYPCPYFSVSSQGNITVTNGMHCIANPSLPSDVLSCDYLLYIDAYKDKYKGILYDTWDSRLHVGTTPVYTKNGTTYNLLQTDVPAITFDQGSSTSDIVCAYSSCIMRCQNCEPVCAYSFGSVNSSVQGACIKSADSSKRSVANFVYDNYCYYISEWSTSSIVEAVGGAFPYLMFGLNVTSSENGAWLEVYYNDLALGLSHPR